MKIKTLFLVNFLLLFSFCSCQTKNSPRGELMKIELEKFCTQLQNKEFDKAVNYISDDYTLAMNSSKEKMEKTLQNSYDDWTELPDFKINLKNFDITGPDKIVIKVGKEYGILKAVMNIELSSSSNAKIDKEDISVLTELMEDLGKGRYKFGKIVQKNDTSIIELKDNRLIVAIYDQSTGKVQFALSEMGIIFIFNLFLPKEIIEGMKSQL